ncbi:hypothetical protein PR048_016145 [Dryococelus australis]|uniref:HTH CENPB-type domain-containing protein n=1 Tax=Dryococelus australis TaxID=614101 RepID=A0ABQ9HK26_9NEOP|nr:hypothetical protein PR048_016145 [Dryococelus australis]
MIQKNKTKIIDAFEKNGSRIKQLHKPERSDVDEVLLKWFKQQRSDNIPLLMVKAEALTEKLKDEEFMSSVGWIDRFKLHHNITFGTVSGEAQGVSTKTTTEWLSTVWPSICEGYADKDVFNGEKCDGGKLSKEQIAALVCANADGSKKRKLFVIGKLFKAELRSWDRELQTWKRKIILLVDNCPVHPVLQNLENIKLVFLLANTTSILQPMNQGVIRSLKCRYHKLIILRIVESIEKKQDYTNCFLHAGILSTQGLNGTENEDVTNNDDDLPLTEWLRKVNCNELDENSVSEVKKDRTEEDAEEEDEEGGEECSEVAAPTVSDALEAIRVVNLFYESRGGSSEITTKMMDVECNLESMYWASDRKQMKITDYCTRISAHFLEFSVQAHEILALEILTLLVETPTDDSVEVAIAFLKECGMKLLEVSNKGITAIFEMLRNILHEGHLDKRAAVAEWLDCSPPIKTNWVQSPAGSLPDFLLWESCWMMLLVSGFSQGSPISPRLIIPALLHTHLASPSLALKT